ncbi:hypothetical protein DITRI_Ditri07aG0074200 [Diplodiscus trichospermus]
MGIQGAGKRIAQIKWEPPEESAVKLNTDEAVNPVTRIATARDLIRNHQGMWQNGFSMKIGSCSAGEAELWGLFHGLLLTWVDGHKNVVAEIDNEIIVKALAKEVTASNAMAGRRICVGISMADRMMEHDLATLLHYFEWKLPEGTRPEIQEKFGIVLKKMEPLVAIPAARLSDYELYQ